MLVGQEIFLLQPNFKIINHINGVQVLPYALVSSVIDRGIESMSGQPKDYTMVFLDSLLSTY